MDSLVVGEALSCRCLPLLRISTTSLNTPTGDRTPQQICETQTGCVPGCSFVAYQICSNIFHLQEEFPSYELNTVITVIIHESHLL